MIYNYNHILLRTLRYAQGFYYADRLKSVRNVLYSIQRSVNYLNLGCFKLPSIVILRKSRVTYS